MRKGAAKPATEVAAADRDTRGTKARATVTRIVSCLLGVLLVLQVAGLHHTGTRGAAPTDARTVALASLAAAIGHPVTLCEHGGTPPRPGDPADPAGCEHCIFCNVVAAGFAAKAAVVAGVPRPAVTVAVERPREAAIVVRVRTVGSATPRGPPALG